MNIPACYLVSISFLIIILSEKINSTKNLLIYYIGSILGLLIAVWFSMMEISNSSICPRLFQIPMCYISLIMFILLILLKFRNSFI